MFEKQYRSNDIKRGDSCDHRWNLPLLIYLYYSIALILSRHSFNISFSSSTVVALSMAILV